MEDLICLGTLLFRTGHQAVVPLPVFGVLSIMYLPE